MIVAPRIHRCPRIKPCPGRTIKIVAAAFLFCPTSSFAAAEGGAPARGLDIYWCDVEGGAATLMVTPAGESVLVDTGLPGERDPGRINRLAREVAGLERIDHLVVTHFDLDHFGGTADLSRLIEIGRIYDPGYPERMKTDRRFAQRLAPYVEAVEGRREVLAAGDSLQLKAPPAGAAPVTIACLGAAQRFTAAAAPPPGTPSNAEACAAHEAKAPDRSQNANSTVLLVSAGPFRFLDAADLTWNLERDLVCPVNRVGLVDVYQVDHHGLDNSNNPVLVRSIAPVVAVMNNGTRKGCGPATVATLRSTPSLRAVYQLHRNVDSGHERNTVPDFIANSSGHREPCAAHHVHLRVSPDGSSYTVSVPSTGHRRTFKSRFAR